MPERAELERLYEALRAIGRDPEIRARVIAECKRIEAALAAPGRSVRDELTAPIVDALHADAGILRKRITSGLVFDFHYRSKIARELVMSEPEVPTHVWEPQTTKLLVLLAAGARHVIIGGAYFGDQALPVARVMPNGVCHGFELNADQAAMLRHNAALNNLANVRVVERGLWDDGSTRLVLVGDDSFAHASAAAGEANTITIDDYVAREAIDRLDLIMLDIEGGEARALAGAAQQLARPAGEAPNLVFEVHRRYVDWSNGLGETEIVRLVRSFGYTVVAVRDFQENRAMRDGPIEIIAPETTVLDGPPHGFNMLAVKDAQLVANDRFRLVSGVSPKLLAHKSPALHHPLDGLAPR